MRDICDDYGWSALGDVGNLISKNLNLTHSMDTKDDSMLKSLTDISRSDEENRKKKGIKHAVKVCATIGSMLPPP
jgi:hypothetical protein